MFGFLRDLLPAPVIEIFLPMILVIIVGMVVYRKLSAKFQEHGVWDRILDKVGGERLQLFMFERDIRKLRKSGDVAGAARLYEEAEWYPEAINLFVEAEEHTAAATLYEQLEQWESASEMYFKAEDWKQGANMLAKAGKHEEAASHYAEQGQKIDAAKLYFDAGQYALAAELYRDVSYFPQAAQCYEKLGEFVKAAENYEAQWSSITSVGGGGLISQASDRGAKIALRAGRLYEQGGAPDKAAELYMRAGLAQQAAELAGKQGRFQDAAELLLREEELERAADMFEKAGDTSRASLLRGEIAFHGGNLEEAANRFLEGGDNLRAAELYETSGNLEQAAHCYEQNDAPLQAAGVYLRAGESLKAAAMYERGRDFLQAAKLFEDAGEHQKASELYGQCQEFFDAGRLANFRGDDDRAIDLLQQVESGGEHYESATLMLSRLFLKKNLPALAKDKLERLVGDDEIGARTLEHFYCLGLAYEQLGRTADAAKTYRKVMTERYGYEDVEARIERLTPASDGAPRQATATTPPTPPTPLTPSVPSLAAHGSGPAAAKTAVAERAAPAPPSRAPLPAPELQAPPAATATPSAPVAVSPQPRAEPTPAPAAPPAAPDPSPPKASGSPIQLGDKLGDGLLGATYKGVDTRNQGAVAVKILRADLMDEPRAMQQLVAEAKIARALEHPSLVRLLGLTEVNGSKAAVTEFVAGFGMDAFIERNKRVSVKQAVDILSRLANAIGYAHERRLLHRNLKLSNILVGNSGQLKLTGFGLGALRLPKLGKADGYPAPELIEGETLGPQSDIYSLGAVIFNALTGETPEDTRITATGTTPPLRALVPDAPQELEDVLARCLARQPEGRFNSASELAQAVQVIKL